MSKVIYDAASNLWTVQVQSPVCGWIVQGEWATKEQAEADAKNWQ